VDFVTLINQVGFPIACVICLGGFIAAALWWAARNVVQPLTRTHIAFVEAVQAGFVGQTAILQEIAQHTGDHAERLARIEQALALPARAKNGGPVA
jgi:hypothetical protein